MVVENKGAAINYQIWEVESMIPKVWTDLGADTKKIRDQLAALALNREYQKVLDIQAADTLLKAIHYLDMFRIRAETRMAAKIDNSKVSDKEFLGVFYGD